MHNLTIFFLGFSSGLPFLLILSTLSVWLAEAGISKTMIGMLAWVSVPYTFKFVWGAIVDRQKIPLLCKLGQRRSWILFGQICVCIFLQLLGTTDPSTNLSLTTLFALLVGVGSAIQDIAIEAYRIEILPAEQVAVGASVSALGYRLGMLCAGAGTIFLATYLQNWGLAYKWISICMLVGIITTFCCEEPKNQFPLIKLTLLKHVREVMQKFDWQIVFGFVLSYKIADTVLNVMSMPFLVEMGFTNLEIAFVAKTFGIGAMILGGIVGALIATRIAIRQYLLTCVILQGISAALFVMQSKLGHNLPCLFITMGIENLACGMSQVALISYLTHLCSQGSTALHYAILTSFASFARISISAVAGWMADHFAWSPFYAIVALSCAPSLALLIVYAKHFMQVDNRSVLMPQSSIGETV